MDRAIVQTHGLCKNYGNKRALNDINISLYENRVMGILGPNGSGKTTLIKILAGILNPSSGQATINDLRPGPATKAIVSYLPDRNFMYEFFTIKEALLFYQDFFKDFNMQKANELLEFMKLDKKMDINKLSKGMKEKLNLALVLSRNAALYILDEPIAGVDPVARDQILDAIIKNVDEDSTMLVTTHLVRDMEQIFDDVVFLANGEIVLKGNCEQLRDEKGMSMDSIFKEIFG
ncbi:MAG: ABC transporter ATP-binding protein [Tissierellia bacterium]|nr:ABC transporter ATP-binding protein [Tissierellia bacterium]